jgi:RimJ/RimL family protein N-acetyltransferase
VSELRILEPLVKLRRFRASDAPRVQQLANDPELADTTFRLPHPYPDGAAEAWIATHEGLLAQDKEAIFAIVLPATETEDELLVGCISLGIRREHQRAEAGYWMGREYWGRGYCTAALRLLIAYGFEELGLRRIIAHHFVRNPASGRVMQKAGMQREGLLREHIFKDGKFEDAIVYGVLRSDYETQTV